MRIIPLIALSIALSLAPGGQADRIDEYVRSQLKSRHLPGVSLAVVKDGRIVKAAGYGLASLEPDAAATEQTVYEIGSISKQFAADAVLLLAEDGKIKLDDLVSTYLPRTPPAWSAITVRHT
jgi:CubicO group peptidase (beta-lactamase class C family)